jgi:hypothetical protein
LGIDAAGIPESANKRTFELAADRAGISRRWAQSVGEAKPDARVRETAAARYGPQRLAWYDTVQAMAWGGAGAGAFAAADALRDLGSLQEVGLMGMGLGGIAVLASLPKLTRALRLVWRNGTLEGNLKEVGGTILEALADGGLAKGDDRHFGHFEVRSSIDGRKDIILTGVSRSTERQVMLAISELLGPVQNPRYLLVRTSWLGWKKRTDYHAVPAVLGARQQSAEQFAELWTAKLGSSRLVYTRTPEGRRTLLRARAKSLAAGFQRRVDRRSAWL